MGAGWEPGVPVFAPVPHLCTGISLGSFPGHSLGKSCCSETFLVGWHLFFPWFFILSLRAQQTHVVPQDAKDWIKQFPLGVLSWDCCGQPGQGELHICPWDAWGRALLQQLELLQHPGLVGAHQMGFNFQPKPSQDSWWDPGETGTEAALRDSIPPPDPTFHSSIMKQIPLTAWMSENIFMWTSLTAPEHQSRARTLKDSVEVSDLNVLIYSSKKVWLWHLTMGTRAFFHHREEEQKEERKHSLEMSSTTRKKRFKTR